MQLWASEISCDRCGGYGILNWENPVNICWVHIVMKIYWRWLSIDLMIDWTFSYQISACSIFNIIDILQLVCNSMGVLNVKKTHVDADIYAKIIEMKGSHYE